MAKHRILVTGANGWIGSAVLGRLTQMGELCRGAVRTKQLTPTQQDLVISGEIDAKTNWLPALADVSLVVHTAARVHVMVDTATDLLTEFHRVNVQGTLNLARQAAALGVLRFVFVSSIKVNGEETQLGRPFMADDPALPLDAYGLSKMEAEQGLREIAWQTGMEVVIIRPTLVYGPGVNANFAAMIRWLKCGVPLPLGAIRNRRSLVSLDNLVDLLVTCLTHPAAANQTFLVSDGEDVSTAELLRRMGQAMGFSAHLIPVPAILLKLAAAMVGKQDVAQRLCCSLQVDIEKTRRLLGWTPPISLDEGLKRVGPWIPGTNPRMTMGGDTG